MKTENSEKERKWQEELQQQRMIERRKMLVDKDNNQQSLYHAKRLSFQAGRETVQGKETRASQVRQTVFLRKPSYYPISVKSSLPKDLKEITPGMIKALPLAFTAFTFEKFGYHFFVILFSVLADLFTLIPIFGSLVAFLANIVIWIIYALNGHFRTSPKVKIATTMTAEVIETFLPVINALPFYTFSALINLWIDLAEEKANQTL